MHEMQTKKCYHAFDPLKFFDETGLFLRLRNSLLSSMFYIVETASMVFMHSIEFHLVFLN